MKEERRMILQMVEEGKISAEEGIALLEALEYSSKKEEAKKEDLHSNHTEQQTESENKQSTEDHTKEHFSSTMEDLKKDIKSTAEKIRKEVHSQGKTVGTKLGDLVEKFITKVKDLDFDFDFSLGHVEKVQKVYMGTPPIDGVIELYADNGRVEIEGWNRPEYRIEVQGTIRAENEAEASTILDELLTLKEDEKLLSLRADPRRGTRVSFQVYLPHHLQNDVKIVTSNGVIKIEEVSVGAAKLITSNGSISLDQLKADILACDTSNGKIEMKATEIGELTANTSNGSIRLDGNMSRVKCSTSNGSIRYSLKRAMEGILDLKTTNGSIEVKVPSQGVMFQGELNTSFGSLESHLPKTEITSVSKDNSNRHLRFKSLLEAGYPFNISCKTTNGAIRLYSIEEGSE